MSGNPFTRGLGLGLPDAKQAAGIGSKSGGVASAFGTRQAPSTGGLLGLASAFQQKPMGAGARVLLGQAEHSSERLAKLASRALQDPGSLTHDEIRSLAGSVLTQAPNRV
jgi:hypothetical protein